MLGLSEVVKNENLGGCTAAEASPCGVVPEPLSLVGGSAAATPDVFEVAGAKANMLDADEGLAAEEPERNENADAGFRSVPAGAADCPELVKEKGEADDSGGASSTVRFCPDGAAADAEVDVAPNRGAVAAGAKVDVAPNRGAVVAGAEVDVVAPKREVVAVAEVPVAKGLGSEGKAGKPLAEEGDEVENKPDDEAELEVAGASSCFSEAFSVSADAGTISSPAMAEKERAGLPEKENAEGKPPLVSSPAPGFWSRLEAPPRGDVWPKAAPSEEV